jgi:hypothetical protein
MEGRGGGCAASPKERTVSGEAASVVSSGPVFDCQALLLELRVLDSHMTSRQRRHRGLSAPVASAVESAALSGSSCPPGATGTVVGPAVAVPVTSPDRPEAD